jgi:N-acetyl sugar amidotransferase
MTSAPTASNEREYRMCARCVMDTTDSDITFDGNGLCNHCSYVVENFKYYWFPDERGEPLLRQMIDKVKQEGRGKPYDSIIGLSGGVDSSYLAVKVVEWGLRPLAVHVDAGWNSELAVKNIDQIVTKTGLDLHTHVVDWEEMRDLQLAFLRSNVANQDVPQDHAFFAALYNYATKNGIKYVISGSNYATESILARSWGYDAMDIRHLRAIHKQYGSRKLKTFPTVSFFRNYVFYPHIKKMQVLAPLNYMPYNKSIAIDYLEENYGWRYYGGKHYESRWTHFFQAYYLPTKFGYDKRKAHLASLVVAGEITRDQALKELEKPLYTENELAEDKAFVAKKLGISLDELDELVAQPPRHYREFPNNERKLQEYWAMRAFLLDKAGRLRRALG